LGLGRCDGPLHAPGPRLGRGTRWLDPAVARDDHKNRGGTQDQNGRENGGASFHRGLACWGLCCLPLPLRAARAQSPRYYYVAHISPSIILAFGGAFNRDIALGRPGPSPFGWPKTTVDIPFSARQDDVVVVGCAKHGPGGKRPVL